MTVGGGQSRVYNTIHRLRGLVEAPSQVPHVVGRRWTHLAAEDGHTPTTGTTSFTSLTRELQLIGFNTDRAAAQLGVSPNWGAAARDKEK
jgi:hypothetical protein